MSLLKKIIAYRKKEKERIAVAQEKYQEEVRQRFIESEKLSPEYDYLKINKYGRLIKGYPIPMAMSVTHDKVGAAAIIRGYQLMDEMPELGWAAYYIGENEIYERVGREQPFSDEMIAEAKKQAKERSNNE